MNMACIYIINMELEHFLNQRSLQHFQQLFDLACRSLNTYRRPDSASYTIIFSAFCFYLFLREKRREAAAYLLVSLALPQFHTKLIQQQRDENLLCSSSESAFASAANSAGVFFFRPILPAESGSSSGGASATFFFSPYWNEIKVICAILYTLRWGPIHLYHTNIVAVCVCVHLRKEKTIFTTLCLFVEISKLQY